MAVCDWMWCSTSGCENASNILCTKSRFVMLDDATNTSPVAAARCLGKGKVTK